MTLLYIIQDNDIVDVSELVTSVSYTTTLTGYAGKLTFNLKKDVNLNIANGNFVAFVYDNENVFYGRIFTININANGEYDIVAYDQLRYFQNHDSFYTDGTETASDIFSKICVQNGLVHEVKTKSITTIGQHYFNDESYFNIMNYCIGETHSANVTIEYFQDDNTIKVGSRVDFKGGYNYIDPNALFPVPGIKTAGDAIITKIIDESQKPHHPYHLEGIGSNVFGWVDNNSFTLKKSDLKFNSDEHYFIRDNFGVLEFLSLTETLKTFNEFGMEDTVIIGDRSLLLDYDYSVDIDSNTYNDIIVLSETKKDDEKGLDSDNIKYAEKSETVAKWGSLRKIINIKDGATQEEIINVSRLMLDVYNKPTKTMKLNCLGQPGLYAGNAFILFLSDLGFMGYVYIISATHNYEAGVHTMELQVTTDGNFPEGI